MALPQSANGNPEIAKQARRAAYVATGALAVLPLLALFVTPVQAQYLTIKAPVDVTPAQYALRHTPGRWPKVEAVGGSETTAHDIRVTIPARGTLSSSKPTWRRIIPPTVRARLDQVRSPRP